MRYLLFAFLVLSINAFSQYKSFIIGVKGDTLNIVDAKGKKQGRWVVRVDNLRGERGYEEEGEFLDDKKTGIWRRFSLEGDLTAMENYRWGVKDGKNIYFNNVGDVLREEAWRAVDPRNPYDTVNVYDPNDPTKVIRKQIVKLESNTYKHGVWKYYDTYRGTVEKTESWVFDKPANEAGDAEDDMAPIGVVNNNSTKSDTAAVKKAMAKPQAIIDYEKKNSGKKKIKVRDGRTGG